MTTKRLPDRSVELRVVLPGYRGSFAANDFNDLQARQVGRELVDYLTNKLRWPLWRWPRLFVMQMPDVIRSPQQEKQTAEAYRAMFRHCVRSSKQRLLASATSAVLLSGLGVGMLYASRAVASQGNEDTWQHTLSEAIRVGGWVASWTAIALLFYDSACAARTMRVFQILEKLPVEFCYDPQGAPLEGAADRPRSDRGRSPSKVYRASEKEGLR